MKDYVFVKHGEKEKKVPSKKLKEFEKAGWKKIDKLTKKG